jgi:hypothetical protein
MGNIYIGGAGKEMRIDTKLDLTDYTIARLYVLTPTGQTEWTPVTVTTGQTEYNETEGLTILKYISQVGDFDVSGTYIVIAYIEWGSGSKHYGEPDVFIVFEKFKPV